MWVSLSYVAAIGGRVIFPPGSLDLPPILGFQACGLWYLLWKERGAAPPSIAR